MNTAACRLATIAAFALLLAVPAAAPARAEILAGCVAPADAGVTHLVGWVDGGVMLGMADPEPPASMRVIAPDGTMTDYLNGEGLIAPTNSLPIWFARAEQTGDYQLIINGEEESRCTLAVGDNRAPLLADDATATVAPREDAVTTDAEVAPLAFSAREVQPDTGATWWLAIGGLLAGAALGFAIARRRSIP